MFIKHINPSEAMYPVKNSTGQWKRPEDSRRCQESVAQPPASY